jgi:hypothetical protein
VGFFLVEKVEKVEKLKVATFVQPCSTLQPQGIEAKS